MVGKNYCSIVSVKYVKMLFSWSFFGRECEGYGFLPGDLDWLRFSRNADSHGLRVDGNDSKTWSDFIVNG